jgi:flagellar biosynthesis protein FlhA
MNQAALPATKKPGLGALFNVKSSPEIMIGVAVIGMLLMLIVPLPALALDFLLGLSLAIGALIMLISISIVRPLDFGVFPTVLLISTLYRLCLNVATTRSILLNGATDDHVSQLVTAFGHMVVGGNFAIGFVIFIILMVINFMVITKGAGRIAEVAARFTLDAMPGKQMAIDAEMQSGHINAEEARRRRKAVESEADFYGAMDGASKFVRGDAIAALIITAVNMLVGLIIGVVQYKMPVVEAAGRFTLLAVGDGLISSIPALMISTAAGLIVTRSTSEGSLGGELTKQVGVHPKAFYIASGLMFLLAVLPKFPFFAFAALGGILVWIGRSSARHLVETANAKALKELDTGAKKDKDENSIDTFMKVDMLSVEVGHALVRLIDPAEDGDVLQRIQAIRKQFAQDLGIVVPKIELRDNLQLNPGQYVIHLKGSKVAQGNLMVDYFMAMDPGNVEMPLENGDPTTDPVYGLNALWIHRRDKDEASFRGYTVVDCAMILATHITKVVREHASELLTRQEVQYLVDKLRDTNPKVVDEVLGANKLTLGDVLKVLQILLREDISVRDILSIFETLADYIPHTKVPEQLAELCRKSLGRAIMQKYVTPDDEILVLAFNREIEDVLASSLQENQNGAILRLEARMAQDIYNKLMVGLQRFETEGTQPVIMVSGKLRSAFQKTFSRWVPHLAVIASDEVPTDIQVRTLELIA